MWEAGFCIQSFSRGMRGGSPNVNRRRSMFEPFEGGTYESRPDSLALIRWVDANAINHSVPVTLSELLDSARYESGNFLLLPRHKNCICKAPHAVEDPLSIESITL